MLRRTLARLDVTSRTLFALIEPGSCFAGTLARARARRRPQLHARAARRRRDARRSIALSALNFGAYPMVNGESRLAARFYDETRADRRGAKRRSARRSPPDAALELGLVTAAPDELDWDDEVRIALEERASLSPDALTGMEANLRFGGAETMETRIFGRLSAWQNWIFIRPNAVGEAGALKVFGTGSKAALRLGPRLSAPRDRGTTMTIDYSEKIPNNVDLARQPHAAARARALAAGVPRRGGPTWARRARAATDVYLRTARQRRAEGLGALRLREDARLPLGHLPRAGRAGPQDRLRRAQGRARVAGSAGRVPREPAPPHRHAGRHRAGVGRAAAAPRPHRPSLYDLRNLFQVNVEEGRHLWAMVYLLHRYFGRDGREEAEALLAAPLRRRRQPAHPRRVQRARRPTGSSFFMFTYFTDRDGKFQLCVARRVGLRSARAHDAASC